MNALPCGIGSASGQDALMGEIVGDLTALHAAALRPGDLRRVRSQLEQALIEEVPAAGTLRLTCGWEDQDVVLRLLVSEGERETLWEWVIGDD